MKWVFLLVGLLVGTSLGLLLGLRSAERKVIEAYPEEVRPAVEAAAELLGEMDKEEARAMLEDIRQRGDQAVREHGLEALWGYLYGSTIIAKLEEGDVEGAKRFSQGRVDYFRETYEEGMEIGDWQELADSLYERNEKMRSEQKEK